jgi:hypothetical protein
MEITTDKDTLRILFRVHASTENRCSSARLFNDVEP